MTVLMQVLTLFLLMLCGLWAMRRQVVTQSGLSGLNAFVLNFAQPALILARLQQDASLQLMQELLWVLVLACVIMTISGMVAHRVFRGQEQRRRSVLTVLSLASNCGFMGYPVITAAFGEDA
ncbi:MAG: AEC family transporter, partial [bacterium]|nr:AEC family transporter [bacterium]